MTRVETPGDALDLHVRQWSWLGTEPARRTTRDYAEAYIASDETGGRHLMHLEALQGEIANAVTRAMTFYVAAEISTAIKAAAETIPEAALEAADLPCEDGLLIFEDPVPYEGFAPEFSEHGRVNMPLRGIGWSCHGVGVTGEDGIRREQPGVVLWCWGDLDEIIELGEIVWPATWGTRPPFFLVDHTGWAYESEWMSVPEEDAEVGTGYVADHLGWLRRFVLTLWTFMAQEISPPVSTHVGRPAARRAAGAGFTLPEDGTILVIRLRRTERTESDPDHEHGDVNWASRWIVRGHWRQIQNRETGRRRAIWIHPYIKGPEDRPLVLRDKIGAVLR